MSSVFIGRRALTQLGTNGDMTVKIAKFGPREAPLQLVQLAGGSQAVFAEKGCRIAQEFEFVRVCLGEDHHNQN